jgi:hypothetical protein
MSERAQYLEWKRSTTDMGCMFARMIAVRPEDYGQAVEVVSSSSDPLRVADRIEARIAQLVADPDVHAATLLMPGITTSEQLAKMATALQGRPLWSVTARPLAEFQEADLAAIAITRDIPTEGGEMIPSEALVLGTFPAFPKTRQAPITALEIFTGVPLDFDPKEVEKAASKANLAHIRMPILKEHARARLWAMSQQGRLASLKGEDPRAKAKVALVLPTADAKLAGLLND